MKLTCAQMDVLISFYIDGDLSNNLKSEVEEHLKNCSNCRAKFDIIKSMLSDLKNCFNLFDSIVIYSNNCIFYCRKKNYTN